MNISYYWSKAWKKIKGSAKRNSAFESPSKVEADSIIVDSSFGRYSYCGYNAKIIGCEIGRFTSIADNVVIGTANHPLEWVSTSPAFFRGRDSIPKDLAKKEYDASSKKTVIGNDVWIGEGAMIRGGVVIGDGAVIGMGSIVVKNIPPYTIVAGNPAKIIRKRFSDDIINDLMEIKWWEWDKKRIYEFSHLMDDPKQFILAAKQKNTENNRELG